MTPTLPVDLVCAADFESHARQRLSPDVWAWIAGGSGSEATLQANRRALERVELVPRLLADFSGADTGTQLRLCGQQLAHPMLLAPVGHQGMVHSEGELDTARGAAATDTVMVASTQATYGLEQIAGCCVGPRWFQLYFQQQRAHTLDLLRRAEAAGYQALMVTLDAPVQALSRAAQRAQFAVPAELAPLNLRDYAVSARALEAVQSPILHGLMAGAPSWEDLHWLRAQTRLPLIAKGVAHPLDALRLRELGMDAVVVSNHGGRTLDGAPASLALLPGVRHALGTEFPVLFDGGIRSGADVFKALASGADAVMIGRLQIYALAVAGGLGVAMLMRLLREELELCMALAGCPTLAHINRDAVFKGDA